MTLDVLTAIFLAVAAFALGLRQILLSMDHPTFPSAPWYVQGAMFAGAAAFAAGAVLFWNHAGEGYAGRAAMAVFLLVLTTALHFVVMLGNVLRQHRPAQVWRRIDRYWRKTCDGPTRRPNMAPARRRAF